ncbi:MAG: hypothetical protein EZS28_013496 [Streblomastix strix]|uniref:Uncharacterized protein n=1 Tax=Streblomastix strix TaxID=222440 RepID=A0A5J4W8C3_9EUKA|nr:MAG: hypothetical protein EZS28_013496 [Streblomastix strix]
MLGQEQNQLLKRQALPASPQITKKVLNFFHGNRHQSSYCIRVLHCNLAITYRFDQFYGYNAENVEKHVARFGVVDEELLGLIISYEKKNDKDQWIISDCTATGYYYKSVEFISSDIFYGSIIGNNFSSLKVALSVVLSAVMIPILALFR